MSTITREFTKEQLQQIEAAAKEFLWPVVWSEKKAREHFSEKITPKVVLKLARIALASLEAEPVEWRVAFTLDGQSGSDFEKTFESQAKMNEVISLHECAGFSASITPLYSAPPEPVSVNIPPEKPHTDGPLADGWNACRSAMLQGADGNSPVIPDCWVACSERLPPEGYEPDGGAVCYLVWLKNEVDCGPQYSISNVFFLRKHWEKSFTHWMPLPAAPQQEVK